MSFGILGLLLIIGFVSNHFLGIQYLKGLRGEKTKTPDWVIIFSSIFFGSPVFLIHYCLFSEVRDEDKLHHYRLLISLITILVIEIVALSLLGVYGYINMDLIPQPKPEETK